MHAQDKSLAIQPELVLERGGNVRVVQAASPMGKSNASKGDRVHNSEHVSEAHVY